MFRPVIVSTAVLCGLFLAADAAAKSPNIPNTPKIVIPRPPAANRILVLPRTITVPTQDESADDGDRHTTKKKKKKVAKKPADAGTEPPLALERQTPPSPNSGNGPQVSEDLKNVLDPDAARLAELRERLENAEDLNDDGSFDALGTIFPDPQWVDPRDDMRGANSQTSGGVPHSSDSGYSWEDIMPGFGDTGSGDGRMKDGEQPGGEPPQWGSRGSDVGARGVGAFDTGIADPSGKVSESDSADQPGSPSHGDWTVEIGDRLRVVRRDYDDPMIQDTVLVYERYNDGDGVGWHLTEKSFTHEVPGGPEPDPGDSQPAEGSVTGPSNERGHVGFYNVTCSATGCTYTPLSMEEIMADTGMQINPGGVDRTGPGDISYGPRVGPGAVTDPNPDGVGGNTNRRDPPRPYF